MTGYLQVSLQDMIKELGNERETVKRIVSEFSCPLNKDVEFFLRSSAITFSEQGIANTHLVFASYKDEPVLVGYYTLCLKTIRVTRSSVSSNLRRRLNKFAAANPDTGEMYIVSPLIAQLGKNYTNGYNKLITGDELLSMALDRVREIQRISSGKTVYVECEDNPKLLEFYESNGFVTFNKRILEKDETDVMNGQYLMQLLRYLD